MYISGIAIRSLIHQSITHLLFSTLSSAITCPVLNAPDNGIVTHFGHTVGSVALYHCNAAGQKSLVGESHIRVCGKDGVWSGQQPHCERMYVHY